MAMRRPGSRPFWLTVGRMRVTTPAITMGLSPGISAIAGVSTLQKVRTATRWSSSGCPLTWKPIASFSAASVVMRSHAGTDFSTPAAVGPLGAASSKVPNMFIWPLRRSLASAWPAVIASGMVATMLARASSPCSESNAPPFTSASMVARFTARRSTRAQKSCRPVNGPLLVRSATIAAIAPLPAPLIACRPKRT